MYARVANSIKVWIVLVATILNLSKNYTKGNIHVRFQKLWEVNFKNQSQ